MRTDSFDLFRKDTYGNPIWLEAVVDLQAAQKRLDEIAAVLPGEYFAFSQASNKIVATPAYDALEAT